MTTMLEESALKDAFKAAAIRAAVANGVAYQDAEREATFYARRIEVTQKGGGPEVRVRTTDGGSGRVPDFARMIAHRARQAAHGPDPEALLAARLRGLGLTSEQASEYARGRVTRLEDGRVAAALGIRRDPAGGQDIPLTEVTDNMDQAIDAAFRRIVAETRGLAPSP